MNFGIIGLIIASITMSSSAQILLKHGMSSRAVQKTLESGALNRIFWVIATNTNVIGGLLMFGLSVVLWLIVLSRIDVSLAYPFVAMGIVFTALAGRLFLDEHLPLLRIAGLTVIVSGVIIVALSASPANN